MFGDVDTFFNGGGVRRSKWCYLYEWGIQIDVSPPPLSLFYYFERGA